MKRQVGYARANAGDELSLDDQIARLRDAGAAEVLVDLLLVPLTERASLSRIMELILCGEVDEVMVTRVDRLSRSPVLLQRVLYLCRAKGVLLTFLDQNASLP